MPTPSMPASVFKRTRISLARGTMKLLTQCGRGSSPLRRRMWTSRLVIFMREFYRGARVERAAMRFLRYLWASPATAVGLAAALLWLAFGARVRIVQGVLEFAGGSRSLF